MPGPVSATDRRTPRRMPLPFSLALPFTSRAGSARTVSWRSAGLTADIWGRPSVVRHALTTNEGSGAAGEVGGPAARDGAARAPIATTAASAHAHAIPKSASGDGFRPFPRSHRVEAPMRSPQDDGSRVERNRSLRPGKAGRKVHAVACYAPSAAAGGAAACRL
jgi:hypothetical protein